MYNGGLIRGEREMPSFVLFFERGYPEMFEGKRSNLGEEGGRRIHGSEEEI